MENLKITPKTMSNAPIITQSNKQENKKQSNFIQKNGKKLLALGAVALATVAVAGIAIYKNKKVPSSLSLDEFKKIGKFDKGKATAKGKPFTGEIIHFSKDKSNKFTIKYEDGKLVESVKEVKSKLADNEIFSPVSRKTYSKANGIRTIQTYTYANGIMSEKPFSTAQIKDGEMIIRKNVYSGETMREAKKGPDGKWIVTKEFTEAAFIENDKLPINVMRRKKINVNTGEVLEQKLYKIKPKKEKVKIRQTKDGITTKNGKTLATRTQTIDEQGNKIITVDYGEVIGKKIITISPDGKKSILDNTRNLYRI